MVYLTEQSTGQERATLKQNSGLAKKVPSLQLSANHCIILRKYLRLGGKKHPKESEQTITGAHISPRIHQN